MAQKHYLPPFFLEGFHPKYGPSGFLGCELHVPPAQALGATVVAVVSGLKVLLRELQHLAGKVLWVALCRYLHEWHKNCRAPIGGISKELRAA